MNALPNPSADLIDNIAGLVVLIGILITVYFINRMRKR